MLPMIRSESSVATSRELELLLHCARTRVDAETSAKIAALLGRGVEWARVQELASIHGVLPLLYHTLVPAFADSIPDAFLSELQTQFYENVSRNLAMVSEL